MNVRQSIIASIIIAGFASSSAFADDFSTIITVQTEQAKSTQHIVDPKVTIGDYVKAAREAKGEDYSVVVGNNGGSRWQTERLL